MKNSVKRQIDGSKKTVAKWLEADRLANGFTQGDLARRAGIERKTINRLENEKFLPSLETLLRLCKVLKTTPSKVLKGIDFK